MQYYLVEFTDDKSRVSHDVLLAETPRHAADVVDVNCDGVVYWVEGPFATEDDATEYLDKLKKQLGV